MAKYTQVNIETKTIVKDSERDMSWSKAAEINGEMKDLGKSLRWIRSDNLEGYMESVEAKDDKDDDALKEKRRLAAEKAKATRAANKAKKEAAEAKKKEAEAKKAERLHKQPVIVEKKKEDKPKLEGKKVEGGKMVRGTVSTKNVEQKPDDK